MIRAEFPLTEQLNVAVKAGWKSKTLHITLI